MKIKVFHIVYKLTTGGAEEVLVNLINHLPAQVESVVCSLKPYDSFINRIYNKNVSVLSLDKKDGNDFSLIFKLHNYLKLYDIDIVFGWGWPTYLEGIIPAKIAIKKRKYIFAWHGKTIEDTKSIPARRKIFHKILSYLCDQIVTPNEIMKQDYAHTYNIKSEKIIPIFNGIDVSKYNNISDIEKTALKKEFDLRNEEFIIGCVARIDPVKNLELLVKAFNDLIESNKMIKMIIVGGGIQLNHLKNMAAELAIKDKIIFTGSRNDVNKILQIIDLYVQPSIYEGMSMTLLEAMAAGLPIVTTNVGGNPEIIEHFQTGILIESNNQQQLVTEVQRLISNYELREKLGSNARKEVLDSFSLGRMVNKYNELFTKLMRN